MGIKRASLWAFAALFAWASVAGAAATPETETEKVLNIYNWEDYLDEGTIKQFESRYGIKINLETFDDEDAMVSGVQSDPEAHDIIITSGRLVSELIQMRLLSKLDLALLPNLSHIEQRFRNPSYDPGNQYSVPYTWGTTAMAVNRKHIKEQADSWEILWNPEYSGKIAMLPTGPEVVGAALKLLGHSLNSTDAGQLEAARQKLLAQRPLLAGYLDTIEIRDKLISGELWAAQVYAGEGLVAAKENPDVQYVIPKEGATLWVDNILIPRDAKHPKNAHLFMNFILEPEISAGITNHYRYANPNAAARAFALPELIGNASLYPSEEVLQKCEVLTPSSADEADQRRQQIINQVWAELQRSDKAQ